MKHSDWQKSADGALLYEIENKVWVNISHPKGAFATAIVQPFEAGCQTGSFDSLDKAKAWAHGVVNALLK